MVELDSDLVIKHVSPESDLGVIVLVHEPAIKELIDRRHQTATHQGELVIDKTSIETSNKRTRDGSEEDKSNNSVGMALEPLENRVVDRSSKGLLRMKDKRRAIKHSS